MADPGGLADVDWEPCMLARRPDAARARYVQQESGLIPDYLDYYTDCPWLARQFAFWTATNIPILAIEPNLVEMLSLVVAQEGSPSLTEAEAVIVPFVRETVHYSPAQIQRHGRVVFERLGQAAFLETVGIAALANALCRMTAVLADGV